MLPGRNWQDMTTLDFVQPGVAEWIAVQPVAAIEQHGPHLPLATDARIAEGMVRRVLELLPDKLPVTFLPLQAIGKSDEHISFPGTLTLSADALAESLRQVAGCVMRAGLRKLVLVSSHGGNTPVLDTVARDLRVSYGALAVATSWSRFGQPEGMFGTAELANGIHGGDIETSIMLHLHPELVRMPLARDFASSQTDFAAGFKHLRAYGPHRFGWLMQDLNSDGAVGNAAAASAAKGKAVVDRQARGFVELLVDVAAFDLARLVNPKPANQPPR